MALRPFTVINIERLHTVVCLQDYPFSSLSFSLSSSDLPEDEAFHSTKQIVPPTYQKKKEMLDICEKTRSHYVARKALVIKSQT